MSYVCVECGGPLAVETSVAFADGPRHHTAQCDYAPYERHVMPNGSVCFYLDSTHTYHTKITRKNGKWVGQGRWGDLPSPSQIAKFADPSADNLMDWAARKNLEGLYLLGGGIEAYPDAQTLYEALREKKLTWRDLREKAGDKGTEVHDAFEKGLHGEPVPLEDNLPSVQGHMIALDKFFNDHPSLGLLQTEAVVYSEKHGYAGRFDARVLGRGGTVLLDLKTSKYISRSYHAQLQGYDLAAEECGYGASDNLTILQTREDGTYRLWPCRSSRQTFLDCLSLYRAGKETDAQTKEDFKQLKAAA